MRTDFFQTLITNLDEQFTPEQFDILTGGGAIFDVKMHPPPGNPLQEHVTDALEVALEKHADLEDENEGPQGNRSFL